MKLSKLLLIVGATVCFAFYSSAAVAKKCDPNDRANEVRILALNMYHEARGEGTRGMRMVGEVTLNRVKSSKFPNNVCDVVYQRSQFSWTRKNVGSPKEQQSWEVARDIADKLMNDELPHIGSGATYFLNIREVSKGAPKWVRKMRKIGVVGRHIFYTDDSDKSVTLLQSNQKLNN